MTSIVNKIKDGYLAAVQWVDDNPNKTLWFGSLAVIAAAVVGAKLF